MCKQCVIDLERWQATGELPPAWEPEPEPVTDDFDSQVDELNAELDAIESGSVEPPALGWVNQIGVRR